MQANPTSIESERQKKGVHIAVLGDSIQKLSKNQYRVKSQTRDTWYDITKTPDADVWACSCPDFCYNLIRKEDKRCKHITAVHPCKMLSSLKVERARLIENYYA